MMKGKWGKKYLTMVQVLWKFSYTRNQSSIGLLIIYLDYIHIKNTSNFKSQIQKKVFGIFFLI